MGMSDTLFDIGVDVQKLLTKEGKDYYKIKFIGHERHPDKHAGIANLLIFDNVDSMAITPQGYKLFHPRAKKGSTGPHIQAIRNDIRDTSKVFCGYSRYMQKIKIKKSKKGVLQFYLFVYKRRKRYPTIYNITKHIGGNSCPYEVLRQFAREYAQELFYNSLNYRSEYDRMAQRLLYSHIINIVSKKFELDKEQLK